MRVSNVYFWALLLKIPYFSIVIILIFEWKKRLRKVHTTYIDGIANLKAGVALQEVGGGLNPLPEMDL